METQACISNISQTWQALSLANLKLVLSEVLEGSLHMALGQKNLMDKTNAEIAENVQRWYLPWTADEFTLSGGEHIGSSGIIPSFTLLF